MVFTIGSDTSRYVCQGDLNEPFYDSRIQEYATPITQSDVNNRQANVGDNISSLGDESLEDFDDEVSEDEDSREEEDGEKD